jgi:hypothetical protein
VSVTIALANSTISAMHEQLRILIARDDSGFVDGAGLRLMNRRRACSASRLHRPSIRMGHDVLICRLRHELPRFKTSWVFLAPDTGGLYPQIEIRVESESVKLF